MGLVLEVDWKRGWFEEDMKGASFRGWLEEWWF